MSIYFLVLIIGSLPVKSTGKVLFGNDRGEPWQPESCHTIAHGRITDGGNAVVCDKNYTLHFERRQCACDSADGSLRCADVRMTCEPVQHNCIVPSSQDYTYTSLDGRTELLEGTNVSSGTSVRVYQVCMGSVYTDYENVVDKAYKQDATIQCIDGVFTEHNLTCDSDGCTLPSVIEQQLTLYDPKQQQYISGATQYAIQHGDSLVFNCEPSEDIYYEPHRRMFVCDKGSWVVHQRPGEEQWSFENNESFPVCRPVKCPGDYCKFGGHCIRDFQCDCPKQTVGRHCEQPLCTGSCWHGGSCVAPDTCQCLVGFQGRTCEQETKENSSSNIEPQTCHSIANGKITDRVKSVECDANHKLVFLGGMDSSLYSRFTCTCDRASSRFRCLGLEVACKPNGCPIPSFIEQGLTLFDSTERQFISGANLYEIQHGGFLIFNCKPSEDTYYEPHQRMFVCDKGSWVVQQRFGDEPLSFENNGSFPTCRPVKCPENHCKFGGRCIRDLQCECPEHTSGKQCEQPLCNGDCLHGGSCIAPDRCSCADGYQGAHCEQAVCSDGCLHGGKCIASDMCLCPYGYKGARCEQAMCSGDCLHGGRCIAPDTCLCADGYQGAHCEQAVCSGGCLHEGSCIAPDTCLCTERYQGSHCEQEIDPCLSIANGKITDRGRSVECDANHSLLFSGGMDSSLYSRYTCRCDKTSGSFRCLGLKVACKPNGCSLPTIIEQRLTVFDPKEQTFITGSTAEQIQHGDSLFFNCKPNGANFYEPHQRVFVCDKGSWVAKQRDNAKIWSLGNNGSLPECRPVMCPDGFCKNGGYCKQDFECECPTYTTGRQCEVPNY